MRIKWVGFLFLLFALNVGTSLPTHADATTSWQNRVQFRGAKALKCATYLLPADSGPDSDRIDDSVGIPIADSSDPSAIKAALTQVIQERDREVLRNSRIVLTGIYYPDKKLNRRALKQLLVDMGIQDLNIDIQVHAIPVSKAAMPTYGLARAMWHNTVNIFPFMTAGRDYQSPIKQEITQGVPAEIMVELGNSAFINWYFGAHVANANSKDAMITTLVHFSTIAAYRVYQKWVGNWLLSPGSGMVQKLVKQLMMGAPFVLNFAVTPQLSSILSFVEQNGFWPALSQFPSEALELGQRQMLTLPLHTLFYTMIMTNKIRLWENRKTSAAHDQAASGILTEEEAKAIEVQARTMVNWAGVPFMLPQAMILVVTSSATAQSIFNLAGVADVNVGHAMMVGFTAASWSLFKVKPNVFDPMLDWSWKKVFRWFKREKHIP